MEQRLSLITLGVADLARSTAFYEALGWHRSVRDAEGVAFVQLGSIALSLFPRADLAADVGIAPEGRGFAGFALAHNVRQRQEVDALVTRMVAGWRHTGSGAAHPELRGFFGLCCRPRRLSLGTCLEPGVSSWRERRSDPAALTKEHI